MYPLDESTLTLLQVAKHWARDIPQRPAPDELLTRLLAAFWRGEIPMSLGDPATMGLSDPRIRVLNTCLLDADRVQLRFVESILSNRPATTLNLDNSVTVHFLKEVVWPKDSIRQTKEIFANACVAMAKATWWDYSILIMPILSLLTSERSNFATFCVASGFPLPPFWFPRTQSATTIAVETRYRKWLENEVRGGPKRCSKSEYCKQAVDCEFQGLSKPAFARVWSSTVPESWKKPGAPKGPRKSARQAR